MDKKVLEILFEDFAKMPELDENDRKRIVEDAKKHPEKYSTRQKSGKFYTNEEKEKYIEESLECKLP